MRTGRSSYLRTAAVCVALAASQTGCVTAYPQVSSLCTTMTDAVATWQPAVQDYAATCRRRLWNDPSIGTPADACAPLDATQKELSDDINVLDAYFAALTAVATDANWSVNGGIASLADAAKSAGAGGGKATAAQGLAQTIAGWMAAGVRHRTLREMASRAPDAKKVVAAVEEVVVVKYGAELGDEAKQWRDDMKGAASSADLQARRLSASPALIGELPICKGPGFRWAPLNQYLATSDQLMFQRYYLDRCEPILRRQDALTAFKASADGLQASLDTLAAAKFDLKGRKLLDSLLSQAKTLYDQADAVKKAFGGAAGA